MSLMDSDELIVGTAKGAGLYRAPLGSTIPEGLAAFGSGWQSLGYATDDGPTVANSTDSEDITAWQTRSPVRTVITSRTVTLQVALMQWNPINVGLYWDMDPANITESNGVYSFSVRSDQAGARHMLGLDVEDGDNSVRFVFPRVQLSAAGDMSFQKSSTANLDVTFSAQEVDGELVRIVFQAGGGGGATPVAFAGGAAPIQSLSLDAPTAEQFFRGDVPPNTL